MRYVAQVTAGTTAVDELQLDPVQEVLKTFKELQGLSPLHLTHLCGDSEAEVLTDGLRGLEVGAVATGRVVVVADGASRRIPINSQMQVMINLSAYIQYVTHVLSNVTTHACMDFNSGVSSSTPREESLLFITLWLHTTI